MDAVGGNISSGNMKEIFTNLSMEEKLDFLYNKSETEVSVIKQEADQFFLILMSIVIFFMQCGFAFLEAGSVR